MRWRWSMLWKIAAGTVVLGVVAAMVAAPFVRSHIRNVVLDSYAQTWASDALVDHMERNGGRWPRSWDEVEDSFEVIAGQYGRMFSYSDIKKRIAIDWNANPTHLASASSTDEPPCRVIWLRNGKQHHWAGAEPNARIVDYLRHRKDVPSSDQRHQGQRHDCRHRGSGGRGSAWQASDSRTMDQELIGTDNRS